MDQKLKLSWAVTLALLASCFAWLPFSQLALANVSSFLALGATFTAWWLVAARSILLFPAYKSAAERIALIAQSLAFMLALLSAILIFAYLSAVAAFPLRDESYATFDRLLGVDWVGLLGAINARPWLARVVTLSYWIGGGELWFVLFGLAVIGWRSRLFETQTTLAISTVAVCVLGLLFPAEGAAAFYKPPRDLLSNFLPLSGMWHAAAFNALRTSAAPLLDFQAFAGVIQFPSFHTVIAVLTVFALRGTWLIWPAVPFNALVLLSTLPEGGHHLADVLAGAAISVLATAFVVHHGAARAGQDHALAAL
jgi:hypothetical protein